MTVSFSGSENFTMQSQKAVKASSSVGQGGASGGADILCGGDFRSKITD